MVFDEMGQEDGRTLMLLPGTCCNYETNFGVVLEELGKHYHLICVNYDGFVGQLIQRGNVHIDHGIFGSSDLAQSGAFAAKLQTKILYPLIAGDAKKSGKQKLMRKLLIKLFLMSEETADKFMACFSQFKPESLLNEYYTDLVTYLDEDIHVPHTRTHFIYANKMGKKYADRYRKYFRDPDIREFDMQHEQWLFGDNDWTKPVLETVYDCMDMPVY